MRRAPGPDRQQLARQSEAVAGSVSNALLEHLIKARRGRTARPQTATPTGAGTLARPQHREPSRSASGERRQDARAHKPRRDLRGRSIKLGTSQRDAGQQPQHLARREQRRHQHHQQSPAGHGANAQDTGPPRRPDAVAAPRDPRRKRPFSSLSAGCTAPPRPVRRLAQAAPVPCAGSWRRRAEPMDEPAGDITVVTLKPMPAGDVRVEERKV